MSGTKSLVPRMVGNAADELSLDELLERLTNEIAEDTASERTQPIDFMQWKSPPAEVEAVRRFNTLYMYPAVDLPPEWTAEVPLSVLRLDLLHAWRTSAPGLYRVAIGLGVVRFIVIDCNVSQQSTADERGQLTARYALLFKADVDRLQQQQSVLCEFMPMVSDFDVCVCSESPLVIEQSRG